MPLTLSREVVSGASLLAQDISGLKIAGIQGFWCNQHPADAQKALVAYDKRHSLIQRITFGQFHWNSIHVIRIRVKVPDGK
jgi:hypothetical protein